MTPIRWPGGEHRFELKIGDLRALQKNCDAGPEEVFNRLRTGRWRLDDVIEPLRLGLIGAGEMPASEAGPLLTKLIDQHPLVAFKLPALEVMSNALLGEEDDPVGEQEGATAPAPESGASPASTATAPSSGSRRRKSTK